MKRLLILLLTFVIIACNSKQDTSGSGNAITNLIIPQKDKFYDDLKFSQAFREYRYINLENKGETSLIGQVYRIIFHKGKIYILDKNVAKALFIFDQDGSFLKVINKIGKGPGEFEDPSDITLDKSNDQLLLYCRSMRKLNYYDLDGNYIKEWKINLDLSSIQYLDGGYLAVFAHNKYNYLEKYGDLSFNLLIFDPGRKLFSRLFPNDARTGVGITKYGFGQDFAVNNNEILLHWLFNDTIYNIIFNNVTPKYYVDFGHKKIDHNSFTSDGEIFRELIKGKVWDFYSPVSCSNEFLLFRVAAGQITEEFRNVFFALFSRNSGDLKIFRNIIDEDNGVEFEFPKATWDDKFVSVIYPEIFFTKTESEYTKLNISGREELISKFGNPILLITKFKS